MGIARFYRWLSERYPLINENISAEQIPEFDNLYLDMNGIVHNCSHNNSGSLLVKDEDQVFVDAFKYICRMVSIIRPRKMLYMAVDGCAPRAKMNQQRSRRFRAANDNREGREKILEMEGALPGPTFDSNCITPGTDFMGKLTERLRFFVQMQVQADPLWRNIEIVLSGPDVPGEGEHKIMDYIRTSKSQPGADPNTRHCLYGLDADLIMLALVSHEPHFALLREEVVFGRQETKSVEQRVIVNHGKFQLLHISLMREYMELEFQLPEPNKHFTFALERAIDDFILICVLVGNDFLPHLPFAEIGEGGLEDLFNSYKQHLATATCAEPWLVKNCGDIAFEQLQAFLEMYAIYEDDKLQTAVDDQAFILGKRRLVGPADAPNPSNALGDVPIEHPPSTEWARVHWYDVKFNMDVQTHEGTQKQRSLFQSYLEGLQWVLHYYFRGPDQASWSWYYPYYQAPMAWDLRTYNKIRQPGIELEIGKPFLPFQQLMAVLPAYSKGFLPACYQWLFDSVTSPILDFYPQKFEIDVDGVKVPWGGVTMIPWIDPAKLLVAMKTAEERGPGLTDVEQKRNSLGTVMRYRYDRSASRSVESPMPGRFPSMPSCPVDAKIFEHSKLPSGLKHFLNDILPGCQLRAPGFPTVRRYPITISQGLGVKIFQFEARNKSLILHLHPPGDPMPAQDTIDQLLDAQCAQIDFPFIQRGKVVSIRTAHRKYVHGKQPQAISGPASRDHINLVRLMLTDWRRRGLVVNFPGRGGHHDDSAEELVLAEVRPLESEYIDGKGHRHYRFKPESEFRLVYLVAAERPAAVLHRSLASRFPVGERVVCLARDSGCFGQVGRVLRVSNDVSAEIEVGLSAADQAALQQTLDQIIKQQHERLKWYEPHEVSEKLKIPAYVLKQIVGQLHFRSADHVREDIGMCLLNDAFKEREALCLPGYSIKQGKEWFLSQLAVDALKDYMEKFPRLFESLKQRRDTNRDIEARFVFHDSTDTDYAARQLVKYVNKCPFKRMPLVPCEYMSLIPDTISELVSAVETATRKVQGGTQVVSGEANLFRPEAACCRPPSEFMLRSHDSLELGERCVYMKVEGVVPCGSKCTVVAVYRSGEKQSVDVVLDEDSFSATDLHGRTPSSRGVHVEAKLLMPLRQRYRDAGKATAPGKGAAGKKGGGQPAAMPVLDVPAAPPGLDLKDGVPMDAEAMLQSLLNTAQAQSAKAPPSNGKSMYPSPLASQQPPAAAAPAGGKGAAAKADGKGEKSSGKGGNKGKTNGRNNGRNKGGDAASAQQGGPAAAVPEPGKRESHVAMWDAAFDKLLQV
eukprot:TRINITY_DN16564_c0_g2_i1.p1 TRINITY_DN16564_c0_g2~~TRINITY_DN16564_c0_g2_i1.p1  ORF type:complete len:1330 (-),score=275.70 TRINITY_DN16564_c0_g2_i1:306-4229(-)